MMVEALRPPGLPRKTGELALPDFSRTSEGKAGGFRRSGGRGSSVVHCSEAVPPPHGRLRARVLLREGGDEKLVGVDRAACYSLFAFGIFDGRCCSVRGQRRAGV